MAHGLKKRKNIPAEVVNSHLALGAFSDSFKVSNPGQSYSQWMPPLYHVLRQKHSSLRQKWFSHPQKGILVSKCHTLMGEFLRLFSQNGRQRIKKRQKELHNSPKPTVFRKEDTSASECTAQNNSIFAFAFDKISSPSLFWRGLFYEWTFQELLTSKTSCSYQKHC